MVSSARSYFAEIVSSVGRAEKDNGSRKDEFITSSTFHNIVSHSDPSDKHLKHSNAKKVNIVEATVYL